MISDVFRKHKTYIFWVMLALLIVPFVMWGGNYGGAFGRNQYPGDGTGPIAQVGDQFISSEEYRQYLNSEIQRRIQTGQPATSEDLYRDGTAQKILDELVKSALVRREADKVNLRFDRQYLVELLKESNEFKNEKGAFDPQLWNDAVNEERDWNAVYETVRRQVQQQLFGERVLASARVLESDLKKQFEDEYTKFQLKYVAIDPKIDPTPEQIQAQYDKDPAAYQTPEQRKAEFVAVSLDPPRPAVLDEMLQKARGGADFAELAKQYSVSNTAQQGGTLQWIPADETLPPYRKVLADLKVGDVSEPVEAPSGYYIYKVEEERTNPETTKREVNAREILIRPQLTAEDRASREAQAQQLAAKAKETGDLQAAATAAGLPLQAASAFSIDSPAIENIPPQDVRPFRTGLAMIPQDAVSEIITGSKNLYVAKVLEVTPAVVQPLEAVRDRVVQDATESIRKSEDYTQQVAQLVDDIKTRAKSLADILVLHPELQAEIKQTGEFSVKDYNYSEGPLWNPRDVVQAVRSQAPDTLVGPLKDYLEKPHFVALVKQTPPDEKAWSEEFPKEKEALRASAIRTQQTRRFEDYVLDLYERAMQEVPVRTDPVALARALGIYEEGPTGETGAAGTTAPAPTPEATPGDSAATPAPLSPEGETVNTESASPPDAGGEPTPALPETTTPSADTTPQAAPGSDTQTATPPPSTSN
ncbi:MAG: SurA N-terminal domain-containing protein [Candidatus Hydrogenedentes bacterium]|nr:SurA N-terminal domain-containing protein [Candidatus Hydrogenedentota bacterium]